jgi:hypothetical protein
MVHRYNSTIVHRFRILVVGKVSVVYHTGRRPNTYIYHCSTSVARPHSSELFSKRICRYASCRLLYFFLTNSCALQNHKRSPINLSGRTVEFRPPNNRHLIVHECSASGPGEMKAIRDFITTHNHKSRPDLERLHAIWYVNNVIWAANLQS